MALYDTDIYGGLELLNPPNDRRIVARWQGVGPGNGTAHFYIPSDSELSPAQYGIVFQTKDVIVFAMNIPEAQPTLAATFDDTYSATILDFGETQAGNGLPIVFELGAGVTLTAPDGYRAALAPGWKLAWVEKTGDNAWLAGGPSLVLAS